MSEMSNTKYDINFFFWIMFLCRAVTVQAEDYSSNFYKVKEPKNVILNTRTSDKATSAIECAIKCLSQNCICYSFNKQQQRCDMGNCKASNTSAGTTGDLYSKCNTIAGFKFLTSGSVTACVWESTNKADYITARDDCRAKDAYLYTVKTLDKFRLLQNFGGKFVWVGLNDMEVEGEFRWEDDNTICDATLKPQIFAGGEPSDKVGKENCVNYGWLGNNLNDMNCYRTFHYICEQPYSDFL